MNDHFEITAEYNVKYTTQQPVPIPEIIETLQAYEKLLRLTPGFIEAVYQDITITEVDVFVNKLETGSLIEDFSIRYIFKGKDNFEQAKQVFNNIMDNSEGLRLLVAAGMGAFITYGAISSLPDNAPRIHLENIHQSVITVGAKAGLSEETIKTVIASTDEKKLAKNAIPVLAPAKHDSSAELLIDDIPDLTITHQAIAETPDEYIPPVPDEKTETYHQVDIVIYASDRDKRDRGWAGVVPGIVDKRIKFELDDSIDPAEIHGKTHLKADILVSSKYNKSRKVFVPQSVLILDVQS